METNIYQLTIVDVQDVANKEIGRDLSLEEIKLLQDRIAVKISWYDVIAESIAEMALT